MNSYNRLIKNTSIFAVSNFASKILIFFLLPLYTRVLTSQEYGLIDAIIGAINLIVPLGTLCISDAILRFAKDKNFNRNEVLNVGFKILFISSFILSIIYLFLFFFKIIENFNLVGLYILFLFIFEGLNSILISYAKAIDKINIVGINGILLTTSTVLLNLLFLLVFNMGFNGYFLATIISMLISNIYLIIKSGVFHILSFKKINKNIIILLLSFSLPIIPNSISWWLNSIATKYITLAFWNLSILGIMAAAMKLPSLLSMIYSIFTQAWQISIIEEIDTSNVTQYYNQVKKYYTIIINFVAVFIICGSYLFRNFLFGNEFIEATRYIPIFTVSVVFSGLSVFSGMVYIAKKNTKMLFMSTSLGAIVNILLSFLLIPSFGIIGAGISAILGYSIVWIIREIKIKKYLKSDFNFKTILSIIVLISLSIFTFLYVNLTLFCSVFVGLFFLVIYSKDLYQLSMNIIGRFRK